MKQKIQWLAAILMAASSSLAMANLGCGSCSDMTTRIAPVRERVIQRTVCTVQRPVVIRESRCLMESPSRLTWSQPVEPFHTLGNVVALPFRAVGSTMAWTGRQFSGAGEYISPGPSYVGERFTTTRVVTKKTIHHKKHMYRTVSYRSGSLMPVGERFTTVKVIRTRPVLEPVGERTIVRTHRGILKPWASACGCPGAYSYIR
jgi:hypothetical protein